MLAIEIEEHARRLYEVEGTKALAEAAQKAAPFEQLGDAEQAHLWRRIEAALREMVGPRAT